MKEQLRQRDSTIERLHQHEQQLTQLILQLQQQQLGQQPQLQMDQQQQMQPNANPQVHHEYQPPQQHDITEPVQIELIEQQQRQGEVGTAEQQQQQQQQKQQKQKQRQRQQKQQQQQQEKRVWARWDPKGEMKDGFPARVTDDNGNVWKFKRPNWRSGILTWRRWIKGKGANSRSTQMKSALIKEGEDRVLLIKPQTFAKCMN